MKHPDWNPSQIQSLMIELGAYALERQDKLQTETKSDGSPVTDIDKELEHRLRAALVKEGHNWIGEETVEADGAGIPQSAVEGTTWIVDPIDGTAAYAAGLPNWGISVGLMHDGELVEGALFVPSTGEFVTTRGDDVYASPQLIGTEAKRPHYSSSISNDKQLELFKPHPAGSPQSGMVSLTQGVTKRGSFLGKNPVQTVSSCVYSIVNIVSGRYGGYICWLKLWDIAAALVLFDRLGHVVLTQSGEHLGLRVEEPLYDLSPDSPRCWAVREHLILARDEVTARYLAEQVRYP
ncbi:MAG: inositol monophosphatase [Spirochaeta sp.]|nr:inositol monophosphatase [Spirochaeta sp.]